MHVRRPLVRLIAFMLAALAPAVPGGADVAVTVYNSDLGLVKDLRSLSLKGGRAEVRFTDVAAKIDPTSVHFRSLSAPGKVAILEQNYQYDLVSSDKLLEKHVDHPIQVFTKDGKLFEGTLLSFDEGTLVLGPTKGAGATTIIQRQDNVQNLQFPSLPAGLITRPTLVWQLDNQQSGEHRCEVSYLTGGMNWHAEYVAVVDDGDRRIKLDGWVSVDNHSGATYQDAKLKLIAGEVHRVEEVQVPLAARREKMVEAAVPAPGFEEKPFFEYHLYTLQRPSTVRDNETKQISLFPSADVGVVKIYTFDGARSGKSVRTSLEFKNSQQAGLGMALPAGKVRVYKEDTDGSLEFVGEDRIDHTPKDEKVRVYLGDAFDIVGEKVLKDSRRISDRVREDSYEIKLRNHKDTRVEITVIEHLYGDWQIIEKTHDFEKKDAYTVEFKIPVAPGGETILRYTARMKG
jgi:hypothetical protein